VATVRLLSNNGLFQEYLFVVLLRLGFVLLAAAAVAVEGSSNASNRGVGGAATSTIVRIILPVLVVAVLLWWAEDSQHDSMSSVSISSGKTTGNCRFLFLRFNSSNIVDGAPTLVVGSAPAPASASAEQCIVGE